MAPSTPAKGDIKSANDRELELFAAVFQCLETEPKVDLEKLRLLLDLPTKAAANTKWYRLRQKFLPQTMTPRKAVGAGNVTLKKRKEEDGGGSEGDVKPSVKTSRKKKVKKEEEVKVEGVKAEDGEEEREE